MIAWSYSRLKNFEGCPRRFYLESILKVIKFKETPQMAQGNRLHKDLEDYIKKVRGADCVDQMLEKELKLIDDFRALGFDIKAEQELAFNKRGKLVSWFDKTVWVRAKIDFVGYRDNEAFVIDWKTGKYYPDDDQLKLMQALLFQATKTATKKLQTVSASLCYIKERRYTNIITMKDVEYMDVLKSFALRSQKIDEAAEKDDWEPTKNVFCKFCRATKKECPHASLLRRKD